MQKYMPDGIGFVCLVDVMGDDSSITQAARVSTGSGSKGPEQDAKLIEYLAKHHHTSPFEHVEFKFHIKAPIFTARQWVRHRTANWNEKSDRYSEMEHEFFLPQRLHLQDAKNMQGGAEEMDAETSAHLIHKIEQAGRTAFETYTTLIKAGVSREEARIVLPVSLYTEWYWKIDLHNLFHFLNLRCDPHAQLNIRQYACQIGLVVKKTVPVAFKALGQQMSPDAQRELVDTPGYHDE